MYSNLGYTLLGEVVAAASGRPYVAFLQDELLSPLGLTHTGTGGVLKGKTEVARGHTAFGGTLVPYEQTVAAIMGAGDLHANVDDMVRWRAAVDGPGVFSEATRKTLHEAPVDAGDRRRYGYGWFYDPQMPMWEHSGGGGGCQADLIWLPDRRMTIAVLMNADGSAGYVPAMDLVGLAYGNAPSRPHMASLDLIGRTQGVYRDAQGTEASVYLNGDAPTVVRAGKLEQVMEYAGGMKFQSSGTVAVFVPRADGLLNLRLRLNGREDVRLARVKESSPIETYVGTYGKGAGPMRLERQGRWLAMMYAVDGDPRTVLPLALLPAGKDRFRLPRADLELRFTRNAAGRVSGVESWRGGKRFWTSERVPG